LDGLQLLITTVYTFLYYKIQFELSKNRSIKKKQEDKD
jgi:hypothetical protein